jgi:methylthioribulose-1-phosphate dehydratase
MNENPPISSLYHCQMIDPELLKKEIVRISHLFYQRGWSLATSSNFSCRISSDRILITASGKDKGALTVADILEMTVDGATRSELKPSAESSLHCSLYRFDPDIGAVLHTHSVFSTVVSSLPDVKAPLAIQHYEMLKAFDGIETHRHTELIAIFPNEQDMNVLSKNVVGYLETNRNSHGFLIAGHGLYTWGKDLEQALHHHEAFEFLLECEYRKMCLR